MMNSTTFISLEWNIINYSFTKHASLTITIQRTLLYMNSLKPNQNKSRFPYKFFYLQLKMSHSFTFTDSRSRGQPLASYFQCHVQHSQDLQKVKDFSQFIIQPEALTRTKSAQNFDFQSKFYAFKIKIHIYLIKK